MPDGSYKLNKVSGGVSHYADISVHVVPGQSDVVVIADDVFAWLKDEYGPEAWEWVVCDSYRAAAESGARYALRHSDHQPVCVTITSIRAHPAHSTDDAVAYASVFAVWNALKVEGSQHPVWNGRSVDFPNST